ncbi:MAG: prepilin-type N-terminal cleavage/methylation domain-containing protein [Planctomycetes bacterium]|nr:prepilin-type N-terminal cleavage/methylation domain-containing protein [Planctomycetota bacterium]
MHAQRGFTLIEVLLAVAITATVMITVGTTFHVMLNARDVVDDLAESTEAGPRVLNLIERDLRGIWIYNVHNNAVFRGRNMDVNGRDADRIDFLTTTDAVGSVLDLQNVPRKPTVNEVGYWFKPNPRYRDVFEMWRREDPMLDEDLVTQGSFQLVHDRVKSFKITYYRTLGFESEELLEWNSADEDALPKRMKIEFTIERRRSSRNVVSDIEVDDFEGAEKTYVRHIVFDDRLGEVLQANVARIPVLPPEPEAHPPRPRSVLGVTAAPSHPPAAEAAAAPAPPRDQGPAKPHRACRPASIQVSSSAASAVARAAAVAAACSAAAAERANHAGPPEAARSPDRRLHQIGRPSELRPPRYGCSAAGTRTVPSCC